MKDVGCCIHAGPAARMVIPLSRIPDTQPDLACYLPTMVLHVGTIVSLFYLARMYHQPRGQPHRSARNVLGQVTIGATIVTGCKNFLKNTQGYSGLSSALSFTC
jgi:hypothetical protein